MPCWRQWASGDTDSQHNLLAVFFAVAARPLFALYLSWLSPQNPFPDTVAQRGSDAPRSHRLRPSTLRQP